MADYTSDKISAYNDIVSAGTPITFRRKNSGTYNPSLDITVAATAQLNGAIDDVATSLTISGVVGTFPTTGGTIWIDREKIYYSVLTGFVLSPVTRGYGGTENRAHLDLADVYLEADSAYTDYNGYAVLTEVAEDQVEGTNIRIGDRIFIVPAYNLSIVPTQADTVLINSIEYMITIVKKIAPSDDVIIYKIYTRLEK
jgi:hypothetical protein